MPAHQLDITGQRFGRLLALARTYRNRSSRWLCQCDCGAKHEVRLAELRNGRTVSCGCASTDRAKTLALTHGRHGTPEYRAWSGMKARCYSSGDISYPNYGAKGVRVCARWRDDFAAFFADMGLRPSHKHSIDRLNNDGDYEPDNCKWATKKEQTRNRSITRLFKFRGQVVTIIEALAITQCAVEYGTVHHRISKGGWDFERAVTTPAGSQGLKSRTKQAAHDLLANV